MLLFRQREEVDEVVVGEVVRSAHASVAFEAGRWFGGASTPCESLEGKQQDAPSYVQIVMEYF